MKLFKNYLLLNINMDTETDIKQLIKDYIKIDDKISILNKETKDIRKSRNELEERIKQYMIDNSIAKVDLGITSGSLRISKIKPQKKINKKLILDVLLDAVDEHKASEIIDDLFNDDETDEITKLERNKKRNT